MPKPGHKAKPDGHKARLQSQPPIWNAKRRRFVREYLVGGDIKQAARTCGYTAQYGWELMQMPHIKAEIERLQAQIATKLEVTKEKVVEELAKIGFANMADYMRVGETGDPVLDWSKLNRDQAAALIEVTVEDFTEGRGKEARDVRRVKFKLADKRAALVDLGKHLGLFNEKLPLEGKFAVMHLHARLEQVGLDAARYSDEQLRGIEDFARLISATPELAQGDDATGSPGRDRVRVEPPGES